MRVLHTEQEKQRTVYIIGQQNYVYNKYLCML